jgi:hypothetical protein
VLDIRDDDLATAGCRRLVATGVFLLLEAAAATAAGRPPAGFGGGGGAFLAAAAFLFIAVAFFGGDDNGLAKKSFELEGGYILRNLVKRKRGREVPIYSN